MFPAQTQRATPVLLFQITPNGFEPLNRRWEEMLGLTPNRWVGISRGGWRSLIPEEYHPEVEKLTMLDLSDSYTVVEFPIYWQETTMWLLVFAAAVALPEGGRKVVGLAQDVTRDREWRFALVPPAEESRVEEAEPSLAAFRPAGDAASLESVPEILAKSTPESMEDFCHDLSGPLTSILVNCELLMEDDCPPPVRQRLEGIFTEAMHINQQLRNHRRA